MGVLLTYLILVVTLSIIVLELIPVRVGLFLETE